MSNTLTVVIAFDALTTVFFFSFLDDFFLCFVSTRRSPTGLEMTGENDLDLEKKNTIRVKSHTCKMVISDSFSPIKGT